jgi:putative ABC transport system ATP-binding protein
MTPSPTTSVTTSERFDSAVRLVNLTKTYPNGPDQVAALQGISLDIRPGAFTAIMGPSGSGKSTFLNLAAGLDTPTSGRVFVGDTDITELSSDAVTRFRRRHVGFVFQAYNLIGHLTVGENILLPLLLDGRRPDQQWQDALIHSVGLDGMTGRLPSELSGGQAQRVAIARALITRPTVVFADEPTGALDRRTGDQVLDVMRNAAKRFAQTLVLVTHDPNVAATADNVLFLADGRLAGELVSPTSSEIAAHLVGLGR